MSKTILIQYNCGHSNGKASRALFDSFEAPIVIALQEPAYNPLSRSTYCPAKYQLAYDAKPETRVCFMIRRDVGESRWSRKQFGPNVATLTLRLAEEIISIINVYNPRQRGPRIQTWPKIAQALIEARGEVLLLGDFNTNHPDWGGIGAACDQEAEHLLLATGREGLDLITATGEPTWRRNAQESTIDLTFVTQRLHNRVIFCGPIEEWALTKDHIPIKIELGVKPGEI